VGVEHGETAPALLFRHPIVGGVGGDAEEVDTAQGQGAGRLGEPGVVADEDADVAEGRLEERQIPARLVEALLFVPKVCLAIASKEATRSDDESGVVQGIAILFEDAADDEDTGLLGGLSPGPERRSARVS
jgi:hypothetical protein